jgi:sulfatase-like protein
MNIVLLVIDSLRARILGEADAATLQTPFFNSLNATAVSFRRAYATECWTLPTHLSMFTGLLPSAHGAHFQTMAYARTAPTIAEILGAAGYHTELVTRNFVFDGTIPGVTRGFQRQSRPLAKLSRANLMGLFLALAKPRVRRHIRRTGFFHPRHTEQRAFVRTFARSLMPADELALARVLEVMAAQRRACRPYFVCCNLYDVHAPYPPAADSLLRPWGSMRHAAENLALPAHLAKLGQHAYLRDGFHLSGWAQQVLRDRYHRAIELMDAKLAAFADAARSSRLLDDTLLIVTSDHGEAFGEHGLYLHDASVYDTHLHVPLWIQSPDTPPALVGDVVSTKDLFGVMLAAAGQRPVADTILGAGYRSAQPTALAEHFFYPHRPDIAARYRQNLFTAVVGEEKFVLCRDGPLRYDRSGDRDELAPTRATIDDITSAIRRSGAARAVLDATTAHLRQWPHDGRARNISVPETRAAATASSAPRSVVQSESGALLESGSA